MGKLDCDCFRYSGGGGCVCSIYELMAVGLGKVDKQSRSQRHTYGRGARLRIRIADYLLLLNYWTVNLFSKANSLITIFKIIIPGLTIGALLFTGFHGGNFTSGSSIAPNGWASVLTAVATSGIVFAFNGFQSPINMAGEAKIPANRFRLRLSVRCWSQPSFTSYCKSHLSVRLNLP